MLHEGLGSIALWKDFPHALAERTGCGVLVYSRYGHGDSDKLGGKARRRVSCTTRAKWCCQSCSTSWGSRRPILLGHSDGGSIALIFAGKYPGKAASADSRSAARVRRGPQRGQHHSRQESHTRRRISARSWVAITRTWTRHSGDGMTSGSIRGFARGTSSRISNRIAVRYVHAGRRGRVRHARASGRDSCAGSGAEMLMLSPCGHSPHRDQREATLEKMAEFVDRVGREDS